MTSNSIQQDHSLLLAWYQSHRRDLPWRLSRDPYRIWISEIMLQQTTVAAVIPYYERFLRLFPTVNDLAKAPLPQVLKAWAGLGYYSRARNLHKAAQIFAETGFPKTAAELVKYPGIGPYTSAAIASIAFQDPSGVLDGNVIRVLTRRYGLHLQWWNSAGKKQLQSLSNSFAKAGQPDQINQALMELGATVCTPQSPTCLLCPWSKKCVARTLKQVSSLPLLRPRRKIEIWTWSPIILRKRNKIALIQSSKSPVLRGQWVFPGEFKKVSKKPREYYARHGITHHDLYIIASQSTKKPQAKNIQWVEAQQLEEINPSKLLQKVLKGLEG